MIYFIYEKYQKEMKLIKIKIINVGAYNLFYIWKLLKSNKINQNFK